MNILLFITVLNLTSFKCEPLINQVCEILGIEDLELQVKTGNKFVYSGGQSFKGETVCRNGKFVITIYYSDDFRPRSVDDIREILVHELIHVWQIQQGKLIQVDLKTVIWKGDTLDLSKIPYNKRGYEIEAKKMESVILNKL